MTTENGVISRSDIVAMISTDITTGQWIMGNICVCILSVERIIKCEKRNMNPALARMTRIVEQNKLIDAAGKANLIISLMVLHDKFDFTPEQLDDFLTEYRKQLDAYNTGYVESVEDFRTVLKDECGIEV